VKEVEAAMQSEIQTLPWMSAATKEQALIKLHAIANKIGYPDAWRDYSALESCAGTKSATRNVHHGLNFTANLRKSASGRPQRMGMTPPTVNAYYDPQKDDINFPAGILQPPLFSALSDARPITATPAPLWARTHPRV